MFLLIFSLARAKEVRSCLLFYMFSSDTRIAGHEKDPMQVEEKEKSLNYQF